MKQFGKIFKFELKGYLKNKIFVGITLFLVIAIAVVMFIPNIIALFAADDGETPPSERPVMLIQSQDSSLATLTTEYFSQAFTQYDVQIAAGDEESVCAQIVSGEAECAFVLQSASSYTYYVNNLSMYDTNTQIADEVLQTNYNTKKKAI